jgi:hypothetical protein
MESNGSSSDSPPLDIGSRILKTLNDGHMGLGLSRSIHCGTHVGWMPHMLGKLPQHLFFTKVRDIAATDSQR